MSDAAPTLGDRLKAERERRDLSAQKAADELHLDPWVIDALEAEDYARIGPSVYAKGHLKRYATLLGLPAPEFLAAYEAREQAPTSSAQQPPNVRLKSDTRAVNNLPWAPIAGGVAAVLLILGVLWWKPWHQRRAAPTNGHNPVGNLIENPTTAPPHYAADPVNAAPPVAEEGPAAVPPVSVAAASKLPAAPAAAPRSVPAAATAHARLRMSFSADSWVDVRDATGRLAFSGNGRANSVKTIDAPAPLRVYLRTASGVQLEINNRAVAIGPQFVSGDAARFQAGADGVLRRDSHGAATSGAATPAAGSPAAQSRNSRPPG
jgi:cytoskeleton protein RodZ